MCLGIFVLSIFLTFHELILCLISATGLDFRYFTILRFFHGHDGQRVAVYTGKQNEEENGENTTTSVATPHCMYLFNRAFRIGNQVLLSLHRAGRLVGRIPSF